MSERVTWHDNGRGPRVVIPIGGEDVVVTADRARRLRDELSAVLDDIDVTEARKRNAECEKKP